MPKTYFLARGWDYSFGSVLLGSIITNPTEPELAISRPSPEDDHIRSSTHITQKSNPSPDPIPNNPVDSRPGLLGTFLDQYGLGNEESFQYDRQSVRAYSFQQMQTRSLRPTEELITKAVAGTERVATFFRESEYKTPVYMITGVKSILGAGVTAVSAKRPGWQITLTLGATGAPASSDGRGGSGLPSPVDYAFQLTELRLSPDGKVYASPEGFTAPGLDGNHVTQEKLDRTFGEAIFTIRDGFDEEDGTPCQIIAPSLTAFDILTASSARTDPTACSKASTGN